MSVGLFIGVRASYIEEAASSANDFLLSINVELARRGLPAYLEPTELPDVYVDHRFGRSALDHDGARPLAELAAEAIRLRPAPHLRLLTVNVYRVAYVPAEFPAPIETRHRERLFDEECAIWCGSSPRLLRELLDYAPSLGIPLEGGGLPDAVAHKINAYERLHAGDPLGAVAEKRTSWLALHEGARLSVATGVALSLAG